MMLISMSLNIFVIAQAANFFTNGSRWVYYNYETFEPGQQMVQLSTEQILIDGDTLINGNVYFKLYSTFHHTTVIYPPHPNPPQYINSSSSAGPTFFRYDTLLKQAYHLKNVDSTELLIYDFSLQVGDTLPMQGTTIYAAVIESIDTIIVMGVPAKRFTLDIGLGEIDERNYIIEGMGGSNGLLHFQPEFPWLSGGFFMTHFNCFHLDDSIYSPENLDCPFIDLVSGISYVEDPHIVKISPNPTTDIFTIQINQELLNSNFTLTDSNGKVIHHFTLTDLSTSGRIPHSGIYFYRVEHKGRLIKTGTLITN